MKQHIAFVTNTARFHTPVFQLGVSGTFTTNHLQCSERKKGMKKEEMFSVTTHSTHFIYGNMASDIW